MPNWGVLREARLGCMLHYDASASDAGAVTWLLHDPRCKVSYNFLVLDEGRTIPVTPRDARAWHAGVCRPSESRLKYQDANSAFYGISIAATAGDVATEAAKIRVVELCREIFHKHQWPLTEAWRIVGHRTEAWPRGRKSDPEGPDPDRPVLSTADIRRAVGAA